MRILLHKMIKHSNFASKILKFTAWVKLLEESTRPIARQDDRAFCFCILIHFFFFLSLSRLFNL